MAHVGDTVLVGRTEYEVVFDGRQALIADRPEGRTPDQSPIARLCEHQVAFKPPTRRYVRSAALSAISTT